MEIQCPKCKSTTLKEKGIKGKNIKGKNITVDFCSTCRGVWFDENVLGAILNLPTEKVKIPPKAKQQKFQCPWCKIPLRTFCYPRSLVVIDGCEKCEGFWFDDMELKELREVKKTLKKVESANKTNRCPKCGHEQRTSGECVKCGFILSKFHKYNDAERKQKKSIPATGIKNHLLNFIDRKIESLGPAHK